MYYPRIEDLKAAFDTIKAAAKSKDANVKKNNQETVMAVLKNVGKTIIKAGLVKIALTAAKYAICTLIPIPGLTVICAVYDWIKEHVKLSLKIMDKKDFDLLANKEIDYKTRPMCRVEYSDDLLKLDDLGFEVPMALNTITSDKTDKFKNEVGLIGFKIGADFEG